MASNRLWAILSGFVYLPSASWASTFYIFEENEKITKFRWFNRRIVTVSNKGDSIMWSNNVLPIHDSPLISLYKWNK